MAVSITISYTENSQNITGNKTNMTVKVVAQWTGGSFNRNQKPGWLKIDGKSYSFTSSFNENESTTGTRVLFSKTVDITHDDDGTKENMPLSASYTSGVSSGTVTASTVVDLTPIARGSAVGATDANIGSKSTLVVTRRNSGYTHSIAYQFGDLTGYITAAGGISAEEVKLSAVSIAWTIPTEFYEQIPNAKSGICTLTIKTYFGSTQIGAGQTDTFTITAAKSLCAPAVSGTVADINDDTVALTGDDSRFVRYMSTAACTITATVKNGASIAVKKIGGGTVTGDSREIEGIQTNSVALYAKDSRGYDTTVSVPLEMIPYIMLTNKASVVRNDPTTGGAVLEVKGSFYNGSFGLADNELTVQYSVDGGKTIEIQPEISGNTYAATANLTGLDYQFPFEVAVTVSDKLDSKTETISVGRGIPTHYWNQNKFVFCVPVSMEDTIKTGILKITPSAADTPTSGQVIFDKPFFGIPIVTLTAVSAGPGTSLKGYSILNVTADGFQAYVTRSDLVETWLHWIAVYQP